MVSQKEGGGCRVVESSEPGHLPALQPVQQEKAMDKLPTLPQTPFDLP